MLVLVVYLDAGMASGWWYGRHLEGADVADGKDLVYREGDDAAAAIVALVQDEGRQTGNFPVPQGVSCPSPLRSSQAGTLRLKHSGGCGVLSE